MLAVPPPFYNLGVNCMKHLILFLLSSMMLITEANSQNEITHIFKCISPFHDTNTKRLLTLVSNPNKTDGFGVLSVKWATIENSSKGAFKTNRELEITLIDHIKASSFPIALTTLLFKGGFSRLIVSDLVNKTSSDILIQTEHMVSKEFPVNGVAWVQELQTFRDKKSSKGDSDGLFKMYRWSCSKVLN